MQDRACSPQFVVAKLHGEMVRGLADLESGLLLGFLDAEAPQSEPLSAEEHAALGLVGRTQQPPRQG